MSVQINYLSYNTDASCLAIATSKGYCIYSTNPFRQLRRRDIDPIHMIEMINRSNILAIVGEPNGPLIAANKLSLMDDASQRIVGEITFSSAIKAVKIRKAKIVVAVNKKIYVMKLNDLEMQHVIETALSDEVEHYKLLSLSNSQNLLLAAPGKASGHLLLVYLDRQTERTIKAHQSMLTAVELTVNGLKVATTSQKGIQIRIWATSTGEMLQQVRRGNEFATIYSLVFSVEGNWLAISSDSCNVHIFAIKQAMNEKERNYTSLVSEEEPANPKSLFSFMKGIIPYFDAEYSFCSYKLQDYHTNMETILAIGPDHTLLLASNTGLFEKVALNLRGGKCTRIEAHLLLQDPINKLYNQF